MSPSRKRRLLIAAGIFLAVGIVLALGWFPQEPVRRLVESRLRAAFGPGARVGSVQVVPGRLAADVRDLAFSGPGYDIEVPHARLVVSPETLAGHVLSLSHVELERPRVVLRPGTAGARPTSRPTPSAVAKPILIRGLAVTGATLVYDAPSLGGALTLEDIGAHGSLGEGTLDVHAPRGRWAGARPLTLGPTRLRLEASSLFDLRVASFEAGTAASRIAASGRLGRMDALTPDLALTAHVDLADVAALSEGGAMSGHLDGTGRITSTRAEMTLDGRTLAVAGWPVDAATLRLAHEGAKTTGSARFALLGGRVEIEGHAVGSALDATVHVADVGLDRLARHEAPGAGPIDGVVAADVSVHGDLNGSVETQAHATANARLGGLALLVLGEAEGVVRPAQRAVDLVWNVAVEGEGAFGAGRGVVKGTARGPLPPVLDAVVEGTAGFRGQEAALRGSLASHGRDTSAHLEARGLGGTLAVEAQLTGAAFERLAIQGDALGLEPLAPGLRGRVSLAAGLSGAVDRLTGTGKVRLDDGGWRGVTLGTATLGVETRDGKADLTLEVPALHASGRGQTHSGRDAGLTGSLTLAETPLAPFAPLLPEGTPIEGEITGDVDMRLPFAHPGAFAVTGHIEHASATSGRLSARTTRAASIGFRDGRIDVADLGLTGSGLTLTASGRLGLDGRAPLDVTATVDADLGTVPAPQGWSVGGAGHADVHVTGTLARPEARGMVRAENVWLAGPRLPGLRVAEARVELTGDAAVVTAFTASLAEGSLTASGRVPLPAVLRSARRSPGRLEPGEAAHLELAWQGVAAQSLLEGLRSEPTSIAGTLAGSLQIEGGLATLAEARATLALPETVVQIEDQSLKLAPATLQLADGRVTTEGVTITAEGGTLRIDGGADLVRRRLDVSGKGALDLRALSPFVSGASVSGSADVDVRVTGSLDAPAPRGAVRVHDATLRLRALPQAVTDLNGAVVLDEKTVRIEGASAVFGGGDVKLSGQGGLHKGTLKDADFRIEGREIALRYPVGLRSRLDADLALTGGAGAFSLGGKVSVLAGVFELDIALESNLRAPVSEPVESPLLRSVGLDIRVEIESPVAVHNNLADLYVTGGLTFRGTMESPTPYGRFEIAPNGKVYFGKETFRVTDGTLLYAGTWDPTVDVTAQSQRPVPDSFDPQSPQRHDVTLEAKGTLQALNLGFTAPGLREDEAMALVLTGSSKSEALTGVKLAAGQQAATMLAGKLSRGVGRGLKHVGIDEVSLQPELLARETDPGARFTFGKQLSPAFKLIYSLSLNDPEDRFIRLEALTVRHLALSVQREDDGTITYGGGQQLRIGGPSGRAEPGAIDNRIRLQAVRFEGDRPLPEPQLRLAVRARAGRRVSPFDLQDDADRLRERLVGDGRLEAEVGARLEDGTAVFRIRSGPVYRFHVEGMVDPPDLGSAVRRALFEDEALELGRRRLLEELRSRGQLKAAVTMRSVRDGDARILTFKVTPGPSLTVHEVSFPGASVLSRRRLVDAAGGVAALLATPREAVDGIRAAYRERRYLGAEVDAPRVQERDGRVRIEVPIREGAPASVVAVRFKGASLPEPDLAVVAGLRIGGPYEEGQLRAAADRLLDRYLTLGYPAVRVTPGIEAAGHDLAVVFDVVEGEHSTVGSVTVTGARGRHGSLVRSQIDLKPGDPLDPRRLARIEQKVLALGAFSRVATTVAPGDPAAITIDVREQPPLVLRYDVRYNDGTGWSGLADVETPSIFRSGVTLGGRYDRGGDFDEARGSLHVPVPGLGSFTASLFRRGETLPSFDPALPESRRVTYGVEVQDKLDLPDRWHLLLGYRRKRVESLLSIGVFTNRVASLSTSLLRDSRDNALDPRRGRLLSLNVEVAPPSVGSDFRYVRSLAQASIARPVGASLTWAQGYQVGLARGLSGQDLDCPQLFQVGGPNVLRGFALKSVGPVDPLCGVGGAALLVFGEELRYRHRSGLGAAVFYEAGNAFPRISDIALHLRQDVGVGVRYESPVGLLRLDLAFPLARRPEEKKYRILFSLGQAF